MVAGRKSFAGDVNSGVRADGLKHGVEVGFEKIGCFMRRRFVMEENRNNDVNGVRSYVPRRPAGTIVDTGYVVAPAPPVAPVATPVPGGVPIKENTKKDAPVAKPVSPVASAAEEAAGKNEDVATESKVVDEKMSKAEKAALRYIQNKKSLQQKKDELEKTMKELEAKKRQVRQEKKEAEQKLKKFDKREEVILALAAIPTSAEDRPNRIKAIDHYFDLLNLFDTSGASGEKRFSEMYNAVHPVTLLFDYVRKCTHYDAEKNKVVLDGNELFLLVEQRLEEQNRLKAEAEVTLKEMAKEKGLKEKPE